MGGVFALLLVQQLKRRYCVKEGVSISFVLSILIFGENKKTFIYICIFFNFNNSFDAKIVWVDFLNFTVDFYMIKGWKFTQYVKIIGKFIWRFALQLRCFNKHVLRITRGSVNFPPLRKKLRWCCCAIVGVCVIYWEMVVQMFFPVYERKFVQTMLISLNGMLILKLLMKLNESVSFFRVFYMNEYVSYLEFPSSHVVISLVSMGVA